MDTDKLIQDLNRRFAAPLPEFYQRRIIFWYDEDKEFEDKLDEVVLENAKVIALTGNNIEICPEETPHAFIFGSRSLVLALVKVLQHIVDVPENRE